MDALRYQLTVYGMSTQTGELTVAGVGNPRLSYRMSDPSVLAGQTLSIILPQCVCLCVSLPRLMSPGENDDDAHTCLVCHAVFSAIPRSHMYFVSHQFAGQFGEH